MLGSVLALFAAFMLAGVGQVVLLQGGVSRRRLVAVSGVLLPAYWFALVAAPFHGWITEMLLVVLLGAAMSGPFALFLGMNTAPPRTLTPRLAIALGVGLPVMAFTLFSIVTRVNHAWGLGWACDGRILEVTRDHANHGVPLLVVETPSGAARFASVDDALWARARVGQRLTKVAGSPMAALDGVPVRMVPRHLEWWNEPP